MNCRFSALTVNFGSHTHLTHCRSAYRSAAASAPWWSHVARKRAPEYRAGSIRDRRPRRGTGKTGTRDRTSVGSSRSSAASCACNSLHHYTRAPTHQPTVAYITTYFLSFSLFLSLFLFHHVYSPVFLFLIFSLSFYSITCILRSFSS